MWKPLIRCSIVGGIVVFLWMMIAWTVLPLHKMTINKFTDSSEVVSTVMRYAPQDGIYVAPSIDEDESTVRGQPFVFLNIKRGVDYNNMMCPMIIGLITQIVGAFLITFLLLKTKKMKYWDRVWFVTIAGLLVAILGSVPSWNWLHFSLSWTLLGFFDLIIGWFLGGLVIAKLVKN